MVGVDQSRVEKFPLCLNTLCAFCLRGFLQILSNTEDATSLYQDIAVTVYGILLIAAYDCQGVFDERFLFTKLSSDTSLNLRQADKGGRSRM